MNVLLITADQWRADCLGAAGHPLVRTPALDRLAADGVRFTRHFTQATPCGPSRASLHTGLYALNHRSITNGTPLDARHTDLSAEVRRAGYRPVLFGYTDRSHDPRQLPADDPRLRTYEGVYDGFEVGVGSDESYAAWRAHLERRTGRAFRLGELFGGALGEPAPYPAELSETAFLTDAALDFLERRDADRPWFLHVSYLKPHPPFVAPAPYHALYHPDDVPAPVRAADPAREAALHPWLRAKLEKPVGTGDWWGKPARLDEEEIRRARAVYYGLISEIDAGIGRLVEALQRRGEYDRTLIVVTSDHGEMLGDHWLLGKSGFFRQAFHVPLIIRDPAAGATRGGAVNAFTEHVDLMPTVLGRLGLEIPLQCDGLSLVPFLAGTPVHGWRAAAHYEHDFRDVETLAFETRLGLPSDKCQLAVRQGPRFVYVHFNGLEPLCFDLERDPGQFANIAADPERAPEVLAQAQAMLTWRMDAAERRLTGCKLTPSGVVGRF
ncbi:MAG TPA: alkaline phosphatase family protein [Geminicoccaceae bacterium]